LIEKLYKCQNQVNEYKQIIDTIENGKDTDAKDKKILQLAQRNRELQVKVESMKSKAARAMEEVLRLKNGGIVPDDTKTIPTSEQISNDQSDNNDQESAAELNKKIKKQEERIVKLRNDAQKYKTELDKAMKIIQLEIGEGISIDDLLKSDSNWKGRAQKIEMLNTKLKKLKVEQGDTISTTTFTSELSAPKSHAEKNLENIGSNRARELEKLKEELVELRDMNDNLNQKYKGA